MSSDGGQSGPPTAELALPPAAAATAVAVAVVTVSPVFLTGALAVQMRWDLGFGPGALGLAVACFFGATALSARALGRRVDALGAWRGVTISAGIAAVGLVGVAVSPSIWAVTAALALAGLGNALAQPAINASLLDTVPGRRLGVVFGLKQSAIPAAALLGGLSVPVIALAVGWRWAFATVATMAALLTVISLRLARSGGAGDRAAALAATKQGLDRPSTRALTLLSLGAGLSGAAGNSLGAFVVDAGVSSVGIREGSAAAILAIASLLTVVVRIGAGGVLDTRWRSHAYALILALLGLGAVGHLLLGIGVAWGFVVGSLLAFAAGWGWPGMMHVTVVRAHPSAPAAATGILMAGFGLGSAIGPLVLGQVAERWGYVVVWRVTTVLVGAAVVAIAAGARRERGRLAAAACGPLDERRRAC